jgi:hypothetical protein
MAHANRRPQKIRNERWLVIVIPFGRDVNSASGMRARHHPTVNTKTRADACLDSGAIN